MWRTDSDSRRCHRDTAGLFKDMSSLSKLSDPEKSPYVHTVLARENMSHRELS
jgi:hypothetical protein